jgi:hypothetical protein
VAQSASVSGTTFFEPRSRWHLLSIMQNTSSSNNWKRPFNAIPTESTTFFQTQSYKEALHTMLIAG